MHLDLCSGIGGFTIAAFWAGFETIGFAEVDPYCCQLLAEHFPHVPNYGDIRHADFSGLRGRVTILSAGVPCQPASLAGKRRGAGDERWLWPAVLDVVGTVQPAWCIFENPPGIVSLDEFAGIYLRLESLGYEVAPPFNVPANAVGAKHRRYRLFIVANHYCINQPECARQGWRTKLDDGGEALADADSDRCRQRRQVGGLYQGEGNPLQFEECGEALADADGTRLEEHQPRQSGQRASVIGSSGFNGNGQLESKLRRVAPRFSEGLDADFWRSAQMPHPLSKGERHRAARLKALGNAVVPQQTYPFFDAIRKTLSGKAAK